jgi:hypothetical protein
MVKEVDKLNVLVQQVLPTVYDDSLSFYELVNQVVQKVNELIEQSNEYFGQNIENVIAAILSDWDESGRLDTIINQEIFSDLNTRIDANTSRVESLDANLTDKVNTIVEDVHSRGVNALYPPPPYVRAVGDGVADDTEAINTLLQNFDMVLLPPRTYRVTDTIRIGDSGKALVGLNPSSREYGETATISYDGAIDRHKAVVLLGVNEVDAEPTIACSDNVIQNILIDANYKAGFCLYATYFTNDSKVWNVATQESLEYNVYIARGWYGDISGLVSRGGKGKGLAFGMPLEYQDGTKIEWTTNAPLELNNIHLTKVRSWDDGRHYSQDNPNTYDPKNETIRRHGYGIGIGIGNSLHLQDFVSEGSGGTGLYVYTDHQPIKSISRGYIEHVCKNSGLYYSSQATGMIIEHLSSSGGQYEIKDIFVNYNVGGGILFIGDKTKRKVWLKNVHQPRFLSSTGGMSAVDLYSTVLKENVYTGAGYSNALPELGQYNVSSSHNTRYSWEFSTVPTQFGAKLLLVKGTNPQGSIGVENFNGTTGAYGYPTGMSATEWIPVALIGNAKRIYRAGAAGTVDSTIEFMVIDMPPTY